MKIIQTKSMYIDTYQNNNVVFHIPVFSTIENFFIEDNLLYIIYESDTAYVENNKTINVKIVKELLSESNDFYKYWGTIKTDSTTLSSNTGSSLNIINLNIQLMNITTHVHLFILENKPVEELRDDKLNNLL